LLLCWELQGEKTGGEKAGYDGNAAEMSEEAGSDGH
jgi:hypothetical protein